MRNYQRTSNCYFTEKTDNECAGSIKIRHDTEPRSRLIIDDNSIYEIDLDCCERNQEKFLSCCIQQKLYNLYNLNLTVFVRFNLYYGQ